jgi:hypothetical protein
MKRIAPAVLLLSLIALPGCSAYNQLASLRSVTFAFTGVSDVRVAGIPIGPGASYSTLGVGDVARLAAAVLSHTMPLDVIAHVDVANPAENKVPARLASMTWKLFVEDRQAVAGSLAAPVSIEPGSTGDVPLAARLDLMQLGPTEAKDLYDLALAIAGQGVVDKELKLELVPSVETSLGAIRYPSPVVIRRARR